MYAVACVYRNRILKGMKLGCSGMKRKDLDSFVLKQGNKKIDLAKKILRKVFEENSPDITFGADHYLNLKLCRPNWLKEMIVITQIGNHTFMKRK